MDLGGGVVFYPSACVNDQDQLDDSLCPETTMCYDTRFSWVAKAVGADEGSFCGPNLFFGWVGSSCLDGKDCSTLLPRAKISLAFSIICLTLYSSMTAILIVDVVRLIKLNKLKRNAASVTLALTILTSGLNVAFQAMWLATVISPAKGTVVSSARPLEKYGFLELQYQYIYGAFLLTIILAGFNVALVWLDIIKSTSKMVSNNSRNLFNKRIYVIEAAACVCIVPCIVTGSIFVLVILMFPFVVLAGVMYGYGAYKMGQILSGATGITSPASGGGNTGEDSDAKARRAASLIRSTALTMMAGVGIAIFFGLAYGVVQLMDWKTLADPKSKIGWPLFLSQAINYGVLVMVAAIARYVHLSFSRSHFKSGKKKLSSHGQNSSSAAVNPTQIVTVAGSLGGGGGTVSM